MYYNYSELVGPTATLLLYLFIKNTIKNIEILKKDGKTNIRQKILLMPKICLNLTFHTNIPPQKKYVASFSN